MSVTGKVCEMSRVRVRGDCIEYVREDEKTRIDIITTLAVCSKRT